MSLLFKSQNNYFLKPISWKKSAQPDQGFTKSLGSIFLDATDLIFYHFVIIEIVRKLNFLNFIFQPSVLEFLLVLYDFRSFENLEF